MPGLPINSAHLSDLARTDMIEQYGGVVDASFAKASVMRKILNVQSVRGTDTLINRRIGKTTLQSLTPGVRPDATPALFGRAQVTVDTVILARENRSMLNEFQTDFNARSLLGTEHGKELGKFFDEAMLIMAIKGAAMAAPAGLNGAIGAGKLETLAAAGDELDPDLLYAKIAKIIVRMEEEDIETNELVIALRPTYYDILANNDKLIDRDFSSANGDYSLGTVGTIKGVPLLKTARVPQAAIVGHKLSNAGNSNAYDVSATEAKTVAVIMHPQSLLVGETIPLTSDMWFNREEKQWFIDSFVSFGAANRRPDVCGAVRKF